MKRPYAIQRKVMAKLLASAAGEIIASKDYYGRHATRKTALVKRIMQVLERWRATEERRREKRERRP